MMLIDKYMASYDVREYHEGRVLADPSTAYAAFRSLDLQRSPIVRALFALRELPSHLRLRAAPPPSWRRTQSFLDSALAGGWRILEEAPSQELVAGAVTQPWAAAVTFRGLPGPDFIAFSEPGFTKIAWNIAVRSGEGGLAVVSTETRVAATDSSSLRRFRRYWFVVSPGVRLIRRVALGELRRELLRSRA